MSSGLNWNFNEDEAFGVGEKNFKEELQLGLMKKYRPLCGFSLRKI